MASTGRQFICWGRMRYEDADLSRSIVCFGSFQYLGTNESGGIKEKNEWIHTTNWDIVIFVEYHFGFGAWRDNAKKLFETDNEDEDCHDRGKSSPNKEKSRQAGHLHPFVWIFPYYGIFR